MELTCPVGFQQETVGYVGMMGRFATPAGNRSWDLMLSLWMDLPCPGSFQQGTGGRVELMEPYSFEATTADESIVKMVLELGSGIGMLPHLGRVGQLQPG